MAGQQRKVAVLIDAENLAARCAGEIIDIAGSQGRIVERRIYGDFTRDALRPWTEIAVVYALSPQTVVAQAPGKNSADIALAIDAMEILHRSDVDVFCIASSDCDFTQLAMRIRMRGKRAIGCGRANASDVLRRSYDEFVPLDTDAKPAATASTKVDTLSTPLDFRRHLARAFKASGQSPQDWLDVSRLGSLLRQVYPDYQPQKFGASKLSTVVKTCDFLDVQIRDKSGMQIRMKAGS